MRAQADDVMGRGVGGEVHRLGGKEAPPGQQTETATACGEGPCDAAHTAIPTPTVWKFTEYDHFADRVLCDDVLRRG